MDGVSTKRFQPFHNLDIPPRKLLTQRLAALSSPRVPHDQYYSPRVLYDETLFYKFLPNSGVDDDSNPYVSDEFRMYEFKVRKCTRSRSHDWTDCPFAHPGEKARRRCPRRFSYYGIMCPDFRRGCCVRGDTCEFAHGVFEYWLHPSRYRTEACKDGRSCMRKICFFAHTASQLRSVTRSELVVPPNKHCAYCRCHRGIHHTVSPTSVLDGNIMSPPPSPPFSRAHCAGAGGYSPVSRFHVELSSGMTQHGNASSDYNEAMKAINNNATDDAPNLNPEWVHSFSPVKCTGGKSPVSRFQVDSSSSSMAQLGNASFGFKEVITPGAMKELMKNMKAMNIVNENDQTPNSNPDWVDSFAACNHDQRLLFSPSPSPSASGSSKIPPGDDSQAMINALYEEGLVDDTAITRPDIEWVNDLLT